jgi:hypothetical protein
MEAASKGPAPKQGDGTRFVALVRMLLYALWTAAALSVLVWLCGVAGVFTAGSAINFLLVAAVLLLMLTLFTRPRPI